MNAQRPEFEPLEKRTMLSGNVAAVVSGGNLTLTGDARGNAITVTRVGNTVLVTPDEGTSINKGAPGAAVELRGVTKGVRLVMGDGDDSVAIVGQVIAGVSQPFAVGGGGSDLTVDLGKGNDMAWLAGVLCRNLSIVTGAGTNSVVVTGLNPDGAAGGPADVRSAVRGNLTVTGAAGDDSVLLEGLEVRGNATLNLSTGGNSARLAPFHGSDANFDLAIGGNFAFDSSFAMKACSVSFEDYQDAGAVRIGGSVRLAMGLMGDQVLADASAGLSVGGSMFVNGCCGNDSISLSGVQIGTVLIVNSGLGDDWISLENVTARLAQWVDGQLTLPSFSGWKGLFGLTSAITKAPAPAAEPPAQSDGGRWTNQVGRLTR